MSNIALVPTLAMKNGKKVVIQPGEPLPDTVSAKDIAELRKQGMLAENVVGDEGDKGDEAKDVDALRSELQAAQEAATKAREEATKQRALADENNNAQSIAKAERLEAVAGAEEATAAELQAELDAATAE